MQDSMVATDTLDDLLESHLNTLDLYMNDYQILETQLKKAFFDLAKAKLALGPNRVGQNSYDLTPKAAIKRVCISTVGASNSQAASTEDSANGIFDLYHHLSGLPDADMQVDADNEFKLLTDSEATGMDVPQPTQGILRRRRIGTMEQETVTDEDQSTLETKDLSDVNTQIGPSQPPRPAPKLPIHQFSAFPPPSLKAAEVGFSTALASVVRLANIRHQLNKLEFAIQQEKSQKVSIGG
ncbi:hypothetical protein CROQUDRAFT_722871 [Cronartium quercuum f. sp. fusiforme G11]|uniref:Vacuolar ATPase assembly protein VMA22 n=1 Tax=Cronartium quercuum f. sp. fusiforme G11 TaxID=708437 RepID=A0A9P6NGC0_9BASI|nr:hypothetical protein CROQUDRAFT_722871 [Cronartium quercuum f. sp. fusiforme G11]